jgi:hypothetical protein
MIIQQLTEQLIVLKELLIVLNDEQYTRKISFLNDATIGAHTRHIIELIQCLTNGYSNGEVDYINRERNFQIEQNRTVAIHELLLMPLQLLHKDKKLGLLAETKINNKTISVSTTYLREIEYNKEHTIHHLALIRVALREMNLKVVDNSFGVAYATLKYIAKQQTLQS